MSKAEKDFKKDETQAAEEQAAVAENAAVAADTRQAADAGDKVPTEDPLAAAQKAAAENYDKFLRLAADMENLRRRHLRERDELRQFAAGRVLEDLLPVIDNFGFALMAAKAPNAEVKTITDGVEMISEQLKKVLFSNGLKEIAPEVGAVFDPNLHEAVSHLASAEVAADAVVAVTRIGYSLNGRLLRPAAVVVSSGKAK